MAFFVRGLGKIIQPNLVRKRILAWFCGNIFTLFQGLTKSGFLLSVTDVLNEWGLILIGLGLFLGPFSKPCKIFGIVLLALYYFAYPPFLGLDISTGAESNYWVVNKNLIEMAGLFVLYLFPVSQLTGIDRFFFLVKKISTSTNID